MSKKILKSAILAELLAAAGMTVDKDAELSSYAKDLVLAVQDLPDSKWDALSGEAQDYNNDLATAMNKRTEFPEPPDAKWEEPAAEQSTRRTRTRSADPEPDTSGAYEPKLKDVVKITNKRGKVFEGKVVELDDEVIVLDVDGKDEEIDRSRIESIVLAGGGKATAEGPGNSEPEVGDTVQVTTKRGKIVMGKVVELDDEAIVLEETDGSTNDYARSRLEAIEVKAKGAAQQAGRSRTRASDDAGSDNAGSDKGGETNKITRSRATTDGGVPATVRLRELIVLNMGASKEEIIKLAAKEKLEVKDNTASLTYAEVHKVLELLKKHKLLA